MVVFARGVESEPPDRVIDAEQVLKLERDQLGPTNQQQIVGDDRRIDPAGRDAVSPTPVARLLVCEVVKLLDQIADLLAPVRDQRREGRADVRRRIRVEDDAPSAPARAGQDRRRTVSRSARARHACR